MDEEAHAAGNHSDHGGSLAETDAVFADTETVDARGTEQIEETEPYRPYVKLPLFTLATEKSIGYICYPPQHSELIFNVGTLYHINIIIVHSFRLSTLAQTAASQLQYLPCQSVWRT